MKQFHQSLRTALGIGALTVGLSIAVSAQEPAKSNPAQEGGQAAPNQNQKPGLDAIFRGFYESKLLIRALNLTPEQMGRMRVMQRQFGPSLVSAQRLVRQRRNALEDAIFSPETDEATIERMAKELGDAESQALQIRTKMQFMIRQILTPEQLKTFNELRNEGRQPANPNGQRPTQ